MEIILRLTELRFNNKTVHLKGYRSRSFLNARKDYFVSEDQKGNHC